MAPSVSMLYILFTVGFLSKCCTGIPQLELGVHFIEEPRDVTGIKGKPLAFPCKTNRQKDLLEVQWYRNNQLMDLTKDKRRTIFSNGTLHFSKLIHKKGGHSDQGEYRCVVVRENGSLSSKPGFLRISAVPENFSLEPIEQTVEVGSNVRLSCGIESYPEVEIEWGQNDRKLPQNVLKYAAISGPDVQGSVLYIFNVVPDDSGSYRCTAKNILLNKQRHSSSGMLTVLPRKTGHSHESLTFLSAQQPLSSSFATNMKEIKEGDNVTLDCVSNGYPTPILAWTFLQYGRSKSKRIFNITTTGYNIIQLKNITRYQAGWYTCSAQDISQKALTTELKVLTPPEIQEKSDSIAFRASKTVRFKCNANGNPIPEIYWLKDGNFFNITGRIKHRTSVNESQQLRLSELIVSSTVSSDAGIYQCMAKNAIGSAWAASRLFLNATKPAPGAPEKVSCESISSSQIKLTWDVPSSANKIIAFSIHYHLTDNGEEMQKVMTSDSRSTKIDKLLPFTNYTFYVRLYIDSASEFSEKTICQTGEEVPIEAPEKKMKIISPNSLHVSWLPLPKNKARGIISQYKIQWRVNGSPSSRVEEVRGDVLDYTIKGLIPGKKYDVRVLAATSKGWPNTDLPWETLEIPLDFDSDIPLAPEVTLQVVNSSSINVRWKSFYKGSKIVGYKVFYRKQNGIQFGPFFVSADAHQFLITELDPETWYQVMVLPFTEEGDGEAGTSTIFTLSNEDFSNQMTRGYVSAPEPPASLEAEPISSVAISLSWSPPAIPSGSFGNYHYTHYTVCFNPVQTSRNKNSTFTCLRSLENKLLVVGLTPYTLYEFKVKSHDLNDRESLFSQMIECHTLEDVPGDVISIGWKALNKTTVQVTWKEPRQSNGIIKNYTLFYTKDSTLPIEKWNKKVEPATSFRTQIGDLISNVKYYLIIRASTSAGLGSFNLPKQMLIPSPNGNAQDESSPKKSKDKQSDHYIGIMVGLGIGMCCIILCTTCILCRRGCLKHQVSQEFEVTSSRQGNGNDCHRERELVTESREAEYYTFLSSQRERPSAMEIAVQHLDSKGKYPNGSTNGIRLSLLSEGRSSNGSSGKMNIYITENPRYDPNCSESPLLTPRTYSPSRRGSETMQNFKPICDSKSTIKTVRQKFSESEIPITSKNDDSGYIRESPSSSESETSSKNEENLGLRSSIKNEKENENFKEEESDKFKEQDQWLGVNSVLMNPDFRFSDSNSVEKIINRKNGFVFTNRYYQGTIEVNDFDCEDVSFRKEKDDIQNHPVHGIYQDSALVKLHLISKEITQES